MKTYRGLILSAVCILFAVGVTHAQISKPAGESSAKTPNNSPAQNRVLGEVTRIDGAQKRVVLKAENGKEVAVITEDQTLYRRIPPGETTLDKAISITFSDLGVGDRVLARGQMDEKQGALLARVIVVMTKSDITQKREQNRAEWLRRGIVGVVTALNPEKQEITVRVVSRDGESLIVVTPDTNARFRRYAPDSVKFADSKPSSLAEVKVGDQLRALGEKKADGTGYIPEEIVTGTFRTISGTVVAVDATTGEIKINDAVTRKPLTIVVTPDSMLRRLSADVVKLLEQNTSVASKGKSDAPQNSNNRFDLQDKIESSPSISLAEVKAGDAVLVSSTAGDIPSRVTAVLVATGVDKLVKQQTQQPNRRELNLGLGLPSGSLP